MALLSCACCDQCILRPPIFSLSFGSKWLIYQRWPSIFNVIVLMKILSGQGIVEVLGLLSFIFLA